MAKEFLLTFRCQKCFLADRYSIEELYRQVEKREQRNQAKMFCPYGCGEPGGKTNNMFLSDVEYE